MNAQQLTIESGLAPAGRRAEPMAHGEPSGAASAASTGGAFSAAGDGADREREHLLARLLESLPVVVFRLDRDLRCLYVNGAVRDVFGWTPEQLLGKPAVHAGLDPEMAEGLEAACRDVLARGEPRRYGF